MKKRQAAKISSKNAAPQWRFSLTVVVLAGLASLLVWRVLSLQVLDTERGYEFLQGQGNARTIRTEVIPAYRGLISDRNGEPLAVSTPVSSLWFNPKQIIAAKDRWKELAVALDISQARIQQKITANKNKSFVYLRRHMSPDKAEEIIGMGIPGLYSQREYKRFYPAAEVASQLVGFTNVDDRGQEGIELAFDDWLQGEAGSKKVLKDLYGHVIKDIEQGKAARSGNDLTLSIDLRLQFLAYRELKAALQRTNAKSGSVVVMDSQTSEVLAMVNLPSFNANNRRSLSTPSIRNRAVTDVFEPGSTMKPLTIVAALESGRYQPATKIDTNPGHIRIGSKMLHDPVNYGVIDITKIITKSSQVGISKLAMNLDEQAVWDVFNRFGLGRSTGSGFPGESAGMLPNRPNWKPIERVDFAFGYGLSVTPLQLAQAYVVFANGGIFRPASLLRLDQVPAGERVISKKIADQVVAMLQTVTEKGGTGTRAQVSSYSVAGKTGTIHKLGKSGYADDRYIAVFAGMAPASNPRLVTVVMVDEPTSDNEYFGGEVAAPVFSSVVSDALRLFDLPPDDLPKTPKRAIAQAKMHAAKGV